MRLLRAHAILYAYQIPKRGALSAVLAAVRPKSWQQADDRSCVRSPVDRRAVLCECVCVCVCGVIQYTSMQNQHARDVIVICYVDSVLCVCCQTHAESAAQLLRRGRGSHNWTLGTISVCGEGVGWWVVFEMDHVHTRTHTQALTAYRRQLCKHCIIYCVPFAVCAKASERKRVHNSKSSAYARVLQTFACTCGFCT